ncbi:hypothetical protein L7F22_032878 [Adiantum nelumboides]|nr:hypothetical protein [Adiantum nelumboides]
MDALFEIQGMITLIECRRLALLNSRDIRVALLQSLKSRLHESEQPLLFRQHCGALIDKEMDEQKSQIQALSSRLSRIQAEAFSLVHSCKASTGTTELIDNSAGGCSGGGEGPDVGLLQRAVDAVSDSLEVCTDSLFTMMQEKNIGVELQSWAFRKRAFAANEVWTAAVVRSSSSGAIRLSTQECTRSALQAFLSSLFFNGFEEPHVHALPHPHCGDSPWPYLSKFEAPQRRKRRFWEEYNAFRGAEGGHLVSSNPEFAHFFHMRFTPSFAATLLTCIVPRQCKSSIDANILCDDSPFLSSLLQLAKEVWLLHKLVFSFHPVTPQLFRVGFASFFDDQYMQSIADHEAEILHSGIALLFVKLVSKIGPPHFLYAILILSAPRECLDSWSLQSNLAMAVQTLKTYQNEGKHVSIDVLGELLERCLEENNLAAGKGLHALIVGNGLESDAFLGSCVVRMLTYFEEFHEANEVFRKLVKPDVFTWTAIISANVKFGDNERAIELYRHMLEAKVRPDGHVFVEVLKACMGAATQRHTRQIHASIIEHGLEHDAFVGSSLVGLYVESGTLQDILVTFWRLPNRITVTWSTLMSGYICHNSGKEVPKLFEQMQQDGEEPDQGTYVCLLAAASDTKDVDSVQNTKK